MYVLPIQLLLRIKSVITISFHAVVSGKHISDGIFWISSPKPDVWTGIRGNNKAQWKGPKDLITHQRRKHLSNWDHFSSSSAKKNSLRGCTHTHVGVYPQQRGGEQCMWEAVSLQYLCRKSFKVVFFSLWVAECPSGLREAHSLLHTCDVYLYVGRKARDPSVISVGEVWSRR